MIVTNFLNGTSRTQQSIFDLSDALAFTYEKLAPSLGKLPKYQLCKSCTFYARLAHERTKRKPMSEMNPNARRQREKHIEAPRTR